MTQIALADNYIRRLSITSSLAAQAAEAEGVWPEKQQQGGEEDAFDTRPPVRYDTSTFAGRLNQKFARSWAGKFFDLEHRRTVLTAELRAGIVGFLTIVYIVAVNPSILAGELFFPSARHRKKTHCAAAHANDPPLPPTNPSPNRHRRPMQPR